MPKTKVLLRTESEEGTQRIAAQAEWTETEGGLSFFFEKEGAAFTVRPGIPARIERMGGLRYVLELDPDRETDAVIASPYGELSAKVRVRRAAFDKDAHRLQFFCEYALDFSGEVHAHTVAFTADLTFRTTKEGDVL